jgi:hypothetical protein
MHNGAVGITGCKSHFFTLGMLLFVCTRFEVNSSGTKGLWTLIFRGKRHSLICDLQPASDELVDRAMSFCARSITRTSFPDDSADPAGSRHDLST